MQDLFFLGIALGFFILGAVFVDFCERLKQP